MLHRIQKVFVENIELKISFLPIFASSSGQFLAGLVKLGYSTGAKLSCEIGRFIEKFSNSFFLKIIL